MSCRRVEVLLEAHLDGELPQRYRTAFEAHLATCFGCQQELAHARRVREELRALPDRFCDDAVTQRVLDRVRSEPAARTAAALGARLRQWWGGRKVAGWQPLAAALAVLAVVLGVTHFLLRPPPERQWTQQDVQKAELQVRWVLAHLGEVGRQAGEVIRKDVLEERVAVPTARATERALQEALANPNAR